jgi:hypothetical protein
MHFIPYSKASLYIKTQKMIIYKTLIIPIITYGAEAWTMSSEICTQLTVFERKVLKKILGAIKINHCWRR